VIEVAMPKVFVSYRRDDSGGSTSHLYYRLKQHFGAEQVFQDLHNIDPGSNSAESIKDALSSCDVLLVVIGKQWLTLKDDQGRRRLEKPGDLMVQEIETALKRGIRVIPVLVDGAPMPPESALPGVLSQLAPLQALELSPERWDYDFSRLVKALSNLEPSPVSPQEQKSTRWRWKLLAAVLLLAVLVWGSLLAYRIGKPSEKLEKGATTEPSPVKIPSVPVIGILPFRNSSGVAELGLYSDGLIHLVSRLLDCCNQVQVVSPQNLKSITTAARTESEIQDIAANNGIDYLLTGEILKGGDLLDVRVNATRGAGQATHTTLSSLTDASLLEKARQIAALARELMGLPPEVAVGQWQADFPASNPAAYKAYVSGLRALGKERYGEAESAFEAALAKAPDYTMARYRLAWVYNYRGDTVKALEQIRTATENVKTLDSREAMYIRAAEHYFSWRYDDALAAYEELLTKHSLEVEARQLMADILVRLERYPAALRAWQAIGNLEPQVEAQVVQRNLAKIYLDMGDDQTAVAILKNAIQNGPEDARCHGLLGYAYQMRGDSEDAMREYDTALRIAPHLYDIVLNAAHLEVASERNDVAMQRLVPLVSAEQASTSERISAAFDLAYLKMAGGQFHEASQLLERRQADLVAEKAREALALSIRGVCSMESGDRDKARRLIDQAVRSAPPGHPATPYLFARGLLELEREDITGVHNTAELILKERVPASSSPGRESKAANYLEAMALLKERRPAEAIQLLLKVVNTPGDEFQIYRLGLARAYLAAGKLEEAKQAAAEALQRRSLDDIQLKLELDRKRALLVMAQIERSLGRFKVAARWSQRFLDAWKLADPQLPALNEAVQLRGTPTVGLIPHGGEIALGPALTLFDLR
jgi:tetratricopeptide (TPR) repeat protein